MRIFIFSFFISYASAVVGQQQKFIVNKRGSELFIEHRVQPKENWYSVGRIYFISPKEIASYNGLSMDKGLGIGQVLKIPLGQINFSQEPEASKYGIPVYHVVESKETLFRVATGFNTSAAFIKKWNGLKNDQVNSGSSLVIGFLKPTGVNTPEPPVVQSQPKELPITEKPAPVLQSDIPLKKAPDVQPKPAPANQSVLPDNLTKPAAGTGVFAPLYEQQSREGKQQTLENPVYGVFKSTSGWQDGKYYVLLNNVVPGTIVRIISKTSNRQLFAKVLGAVPAGKESEGMIMRMSNATMAALGMTEGVIGSVELSWFN